MPNDTTRTPPVVWDLNHNRVLAFSGKHVQSRMDLREPDALQLEYTRIMMAFLLHVPAPRAIAMVGLGGGSLPKFCHRHLPHAHVTVIEIDADVIATRDAFAVPPDGSRFCVHHADAADFMQHCEAEFDVILVDGFDQHGLSPQLATAEFFQDCKKALTPRGMLVVNLHGCDSRYETVFNQIQQTFDGYAMDVTCSKSSNRVAFASSPDSQAWSHLARIERPMGFDLHAWKTLMPSLWRVAFQARQKPMHTHK